MKRILSILTAILILICNTTVALANDTYLTEYWTEDSQVAQNIIDYVLDVTDEESLNFIPVEDRIAVFDLDGTLINENYPRCFEWMMFVDYALKHHVSDEVRNTAQEIIDTKWGTKPSNMSYRQAKAAARAYEGMTTEELYNYAIAFKSSKAEGFTNLTRGDAWYLPMLELVEFLQEKQFTIYIVSASETYTVRAVVNGYIDIPEQNIIGTEFGLRASNQSVEADMNYQYQNTDVIVYSGEYYGENAKQAKVISIMRYIGKQPVLAFGNSSGDISMMDYCLINNYYISKAYMVVNDDDVREYGSEESANKTKETCEEHGFEVISMKDDFRTIYGEDVIKK